MLFMRDDHELLIQPPLGCQNETLSTVGDKKSSNKLDKITIDTSQTINERVDALETQGEGFRNNQHDLEASYAHYLDLYEHAPVGYLTLNAEGTITEINLTAEKQFEIDRSSIINRPFESFIADGYRLRWHQHFELVKQNGEQFSCDLPFQFNKTTLRYCHLDCKYIFKGLLPGTMLVALTSIVKLDQLPDTACLALALSCAQVVTWDWDIKTGRKVYNDCWAKMRGYRQDEIGSNHSSWVNDIHPNDIPIVQKAIAEYFISIRPFFRAEYRIRTKAGSWLWILDRGAVIERDAQGNPLRMAGIKKNITQRKLVEADLRVASVVFETHEAVIVTNANKVILRVNKAFTRLTGYCIEEVVGKPPVFLYSDEYDEDFYRHLWETAYTNHFWQGEIWEKRKNGEIYPIWLTLTAITNTMGCITHYVGTFTDISSLKQTEKILLDARDHLKNQATHTAEELEKNKAETAEINAALNILLKHREADKNYAQIALSSEVDATIIPLLKKLKTASVGRHQSVRLIKIIEANLLQMVKSYGRSDKLAAAYQKLTPVEVQVAAMIRQGQPTKVIAAALNIAESTVSIHRKHIRKKFGLDGKSDNLYSFLLSLVD